MTTRAARMLSIENLDVFYGRIQALRGLTLNVEEGEIVTLLGANGAGKTTTLRTISGQQPPAAGSITFDGYRIDGLRAHEIVSLGLTHVPEGRRIFPRMTVLENLRIGAYQKRGSAAADLDRVFELFPVLKERRTQDGGTLSGGEQQMLAIGRALMGKPRLLLLDEPSMGLAPMVVTRIFEILAQINAQGTTILLVEQNAAQALKLASRGYVLETGTITLSDRAQTLLADDRVRSAYLGESAAS